MTAQFNLFIATDRSGPPESAESTAAKVDRVFVPLSDAPYRWFASGSKRWELRRLGRQYTRKHLLLGRRVELRRGYSDKHTALWGHIAEVREAENIARFFDAVDFKEVIPEATCRDEAQRTATQILGDAQAPVIGFRVEPDPIAELVLDAIYMPWVRGGRKHSTVRKGARELRSRLADLVSGRERVRVIVTDLKVKTFGDLSPSDARRDGFENLADLESALRHYYPGIAPSDPVTIIGFTPLAENP